MRDGNILSHSNVDSNAFMFDHGSGSVSTKSVSDKDVETGSLLHKEKDYSDSNSSDESDNESETSSNHEDEMLPLMERLKRKKEKIIDIKKLRKRKSSALKVAKERLAETKVNNRNGNTANDTIQKKKRSKHSPTEVSSKRSYFYRNRKMNLGSKENGIGVDVVAHHYKPRDPRIDCIKGDKPNLDLDSRYDFIQDIRSKEILNIEKQIKALKATNSSGIRRRKRKGLSLASLPEYEAKLEQLKHKKADFERRQIDQAAKQSAHKQIVQNTANGNGGIFFPKRREIKRLELEAKFDEIRKRGGDAAVDKIVAKRRQKNKSRDANLVGGLK